MKVTVLVSLFALAACVRCVAGTTGVMNGYVRDESGHPAADVLVSVISPTQTGKTYTDKRGFFVFVALPPDVYSVEAEKSGTSDAYATDVRINSDQTTFLNFRFSSYRGCGPVFTPVTLAANQESEPFWSLDVRRMEQYPPNAAPLILLPMVRAVQRQRCL